jgi:hypothetical protein
MHIPKLLTTFAENFSKTKMKLKTMNIHHLNTLRFFNISNLVVSRYFLERERERERERLL